MKSEETIKRSTCYECDANCVFDITIDAVGKAIAVDGPPCPRGQAQLEREYYPDRLLHPLRRVGPKGSGEFERITWQEAISSIAKGLQTGRDKHGAPAVDVFLDIPRKQGRNYNVWHMHLVALTF